MLLAFLHFAFYNPSQPANRYFARFALTVAVASLLGYGSQVLVFSTYVSYLVAQAAVPGGGQRVVGGQVGAGVVGSHGGLPVAVLLGAHAVRPVRSYQFRDAQARDAPAAKAELACTRCSFSSSVICWMRAVMAASCVSSAAWRLALAAGFGLGLAVLTGLVWARAEPAAAQQKAVPSTVAKRRKKSIAVNR